MPESEGGEGGFDEDRVSSYGYAQRVSQRLPPTLQTPPNRGLIPGVFCRWHNTEVLNPNDIPCSNSAGIRSCMECSHAYVQFLNVMGHVRKVEATLYRSDLKPIPTVNPFAKKDNNPTRFEDII